MRSVPTIAAIAATTFAAPAIAADAVPDLTGFWGRGTFDFEAIPAAPPPIGNLYRLPSGSSDPTRPAGDYNNPILKPEAAAIVKARAEKALNGITFPDPSTRCAPYNPPFVAAMQLGVQFLQQKDRITILYNQDDQVRYVRLNGKHPDRVTPSWKGDSIGHYEGDTLVIDTINFNGRLNFRGTGENLHLIERFTRTGDDTLAYEYTVDAPKNWTRPWTVRLDMTDKGGHIFEFSCHEGNSISIVGTLKGARMEEQRQPAGR